MELISALAFLFFAAVAVGVSKDDCCESPDLLLVPLVTLLLVCLACL